MTFFIDIYSLRKKSFHNARIRFILQLLHKAEDIEGISIKDLKTYWVFDIAFERFVYLYAFE